MTPPDVNAVIATSELEQRTKRQPDLELENQTLRDLLRSLTASPQAFYKRLVEAALRLSNADSTGISLLDQERKRFVWPAVAGGLSHYLGGGTPSDFGPCGTVLERNTAVLFQRPERHFTYLEPIVPPLEEVLLIPFHMDGKPVGTIWAVIHQSGKKFDAEDRRLLESLSAFAAAAYRSLVDAGALSSLLEKPA